MVSFVDRLFDIKETSLYKLSIQVSLDGFIFYISGDNGQCLCSKTFATKNISDLDSIFTLEPILRKPFKSVKCICLSQRSTLIPEYLFDKTKIKEYIEFVCNVEKTDEIFYKKIEKINAYSVYAVNSELCRKIKQYQPETIFYNQNIPLINETLNLSGKNMTVCFCNKFIDITAANNKKLVIQNTYKTESLSDAIYFVASVIKETELNPDSIYISGNIGRYEEEEFLRFFGQAKLEINRNLIFTIGAENSLPILTLQKLSKCE